MTSGESGNVVKIDPAAMTRREIAAMLKAAAAGAVSASGSETSLSGQGENTAASTTAPAADGTATAAPAGQEASSAQWPDIQPDAGSSVLWLNQKAGELPETALNKLLDVVSGAADSTGAEKDALLPQAAALPVAQLGKELLHLAVLYLSRHALPAGSAVWGRILLCMGLTLLCALPMWLLLNLFYERMRHREIRGY